MLGKKIKIVITDGWVATKQTRKSDGVVTVEYLTEFNIFIRSNPIRRVQRDRYRLVDYKGRHKEFSPCELYKHFNKHFAL